MIFTLIGYPVEHSLSPIIQNVAFSALGIDARYFISPVQSEGLERAVSVLRRDDCGGFNVTAPYKIAVMRNLERLDKSAEIAGAVNAVKNEKGVLRGYNFDGDAAVRSLEESGVIVKGKRIVILGAGGAASAVAVSLARKYGDSIKIILLNRTIENAVRLAKKVRPFTPVTVAGLKKEVVKGFLSSAQILINATGVKGEEEIFGVISDEVKNCKDLGLVFDLVYSERTALMDAAFASGAKVIDGGKMLVEQAALSFRLWTGAEPPREIMWNAFSGGLKRNIVLIGFMGAGKTTVAKELARKTGRKYISTDSLAEKRAGASISEIFGCFGERRFREVEVQIVREIRNVKNTVIDCGGGVVLNPDNVSALKETGVIVWLYCSEEEILRRTLRNPQTRPLIEGRTPDEILGLYKGRERLYRDCASVRFDTSALSSDDTVSRIREITEATVWEL